MTPSAQRIEEISIERIRRDAAMVARGYFGLSFLPLFFLLFLLLPIAREWPDLDTGRLANPLIWLLVAASALFLMAARNCGVKLCRRCLWFLVISVSALLTGALAAAIGFAAHFGVAEKLLQLPAAAVALMGLPVLILLLLIAYLLLVPARAAMRLMRTRVTALGALFPAIMTVTDRPAGDRRPAPPPQERPASISLAAAAWIVGIASAVLVLWLFARDQKLIALAIEFAAIYAVILLVRWSRRYAAIDAAEMMKADPRAPILYLRSFQDDPNLLEAEWDIVLNLPPRKDAAKSKLGAIARKLSGATTGWLSTSGRVEEVLAAEFRSLGPFIAIGAPDEPLPELGAARSYFDNDTWQGAIVRWVDMAQLIVKVAGPTQWIRWELDKIGERGAMEKLIILIPPGDAANRAARWRNIELALNDTEWRPAMQQLDPGRVVAMAFLAGGRLSVVTGGKGRMLDYLLALRLLLYRKLEASQG